MDDNIKLQLLGENPTTLWWDDEVRGMPNSMIRSALFGVFKKGKSVEYDKELISSATGIQIIFTGTSLNQSDLDIFLELLHISKKRIANNVMEFGQVEILAKDLLKSTNRSAGGGDIEWLLKVIKRLRAADVEIRDRQYIYSGRLVHDLLYDQKLKKYWLQINPSIANIFGACGFTKVDTSIRSKLAGLPKAQWIFNFYSSHMETNIFNYSVKKINELMGVKNLDQYGSGRDLMEMMRKVEDATRHKIEVGDEIHVVGWRFTFELSKGNKESGNNVLILLDKNNIFAKSCKPKNDVKDKDDEPF